MTDTSLILVIDDDLPLQQAVVQVLNRASYRTCQANDGRTGLQMARDQKPDLVLLNAVLPDINGQEVCRQIKTDPVLTGCFVVLFFGSRTDSQSQVEGLEGGADGYIARPVKNDELLARVRGLLRIKYAEDQLHESEARYKSLFENNHAVMLIIDPDSAAIIDANSAACAYYGWSHQELLNKRIDEINTLATEEVEVEMQLARAEKRNHFLFKHRRADGSIREVEVYSGPLILTGKTLLYSIVHDITDRKEAEEALRESEERYRELIENANDIVYTLDLAGNFTSVNRAAECITGYTRQEILALNLAQVTSPDDFALARQMLQSKLTEGRPTAPYPLDIYAKDGHKVSLELNARLIYQEGRLVGSQGIARDITERKRVEEALRESEENYHTLFREMLDGFALQEIICDGQGNPADYRFLAVNSAFERMTGLKEQDIVGRTVLEVLPGTERYWIETYGKVALTGEPAFFANYSAELQKHFQVTAFRPAPNQFACIFADITERKRAEEALREFSTVLEQRVADRTRQLAAANARLTEIDRLKDDFISRISHELRTPLVNIKLYLDLLEHGKPEKHDQYMETLRREAARLLQLIEDLLRISELDRDATRLQLAPIDLNQLLAQLVNDRSGLARDRDLQIESRLSPDLPKAAADPALLLQALSNLMTNATNYTPAGGTITLSTALQPGENQAWVTCTIRDSGPGISAKDRPHIFERFYRGEVAKDYTIPGTGLGLSICQEIVNKLGGHITVESEPATKGSGAAFTVWLKLAN